MGTRRKSRELALQMLFQADLGKQPIDDVRQTFWKGRGEVTPEVKGFTEDLFRVAQDRAADIDKLIEDHAENWRMDRMAAVDRNILRLAIFEMLHRDDIPPVVSINEAVDIAKKFSTQDSGKFVNGILDKVKGELMRPARAVK